MINLQNYSDGYIDKILRSPYRKISFRYDLLNRMDNNIGTLEAVTKAAVKYGEFNDIKRSATFELSGHDRKEINFLNDRIKPWFILHMPDGGVVEWPLGVFLLLSPDVGVKGREKTRNIGAYDKTIIISEYGLRNRHYIPAGTSYTAAVKQLLSMAGITEFDIPDSPAQLSSDMEFGAGTTCKEAVARLLTAINYSSMGVDANGVFFSQPYVPPAERPVTIKYDSGRDSILEMEFKESLDVAGRANVFVRVAANEESERPLTSVYVNDNPQSPISTVSRGREIMDFGEIENASSQEALDGLVKRIAVESTSAYSHFSFSTLLMPYHGSAETLWLNIPEVFPAVVKYSETSWEMPLDYNGKMRHEARAAIAL